MAPPQYHYEGAGRINIDIGVGIICQCAIAVVLMLLASFLICFICAARIAAELIVIISRVLMIPEQHNHIARHEAAMPARASDDSIKVILPCRPNCAAPLARYFGVHRLWNYADAI